MFLFLLSLRTDHDKVHDDKQERDHQKRHNIAQAAAGLRGRSCCVQKHRSKPPKFHLQNGKVRLCAVFPLIKTIIYVSISYIDGIFNNNL